MNLQPLVVWFVITLMPLSADGGKKNRIQGLRWWNLAQSVSFTAMLSSPADRIYINPSLQPLTRKQRRLVRKNPGIVVAIAKGARIAIEECQHQFKDRRWNCPVSDDPNSSTIFGKVLKRACRETAFIYAITSGGVTHSVAYACSEGSVFTCSCGNKIQVFHPNSAFAPSDWEWGGCSDNIEFGHKFSRDFVDVVERGRDLKYTMNLHNNEAGRLTISTQMRQECKCHGMSGSCTLKTCWMRLPPFRKVGTKLKDRFDGASKISQGNTGNQKGRSRNKATKFKLDPINHNHKRPGPMDLVYYEDSPTFCDNNNSIGYSGTSGRECKADSLGVDGCDLMCCQRGFDTQVYQARERCNCTFHWCCEVTCEVCHVQKVRHICH